MLQSLMVALLNQNKFAYEGLILDVRAPNVMLNDKIISVRGMLY